MQYDGRYKIFDINKIKTYPLSTRSNKVTLDDLIKPGDIDNIVIDLPEKICSDIETIANKILSARKSDKPVVLFTGAHLIKNGLGPLLADLVKHDFLSLVAGNCATAIHDFGHKLMNTMHRTDKFEGFLSGHDGGESHRFF